jgi:hypothetical protein
MQLPTSTYSDITKLMHMLFSPECDVSIDLKATQHSGPRDFKILN